ncbi:hypothetical protein Tco_0595217 [Tanacetum coccineum]
MVTDEDLSKPFKEVLKWPFTRRIIKFLSLGHKMPTNAKIYDKMEASEKLAKHSMELGVYDITYEPCNVIKGQVLSDFIKEVPVGSDALVHRCTSYIMDQQRDAKEEWVLYRRSIQNQGFRSLSSPHHPYEDIIHIYPTAQLH